MIKKVKVRRVRGCEADDTPQQSAGRMDYGLSSTVLFAILLAGRHHVTVCTDLDVDASLIGTKIIRSIVRTGGDFSTTPLDPT